MKKYKWKFNNNRGVTGADLVISVVLILLFVGLLTNLMSSTYKRALEIQKSANAMSYATIILEKVDEKAYDEIKTGFIEQLVQDGEIQLNEDYKINFTVVNLANVQTEISDIMKKVTVEVKYTINKEEKAMYISKIKVKEIHHENI